MSSWREFETEWTNYLNANYGELASFEHVGDADSTSPDIKVVTISKKAFNIEVKKCPAQCGQFVLFPDDKTKTFIYSEQNSTPYNKYAKSIINHMNRHYSDFNKADKGGTDIVFANSSQIFAGWIIKTYKNKGVELFGTNNHRLFPIKDIAKHFVITAKYRIKRSGSREVGNGKIKEVTDCIGKNFKILSYKTTNDGKLFYKASSSMNKKKFTLGNDEYMFSKRGNEYEIRKLSNTYNRNVIFSVKLNKTAPSGMSDQEIKDYLK